MPSGAMINVPQASTITHEDYLEFKKNQSLEKKRSELELAEEFNDPMRNLDSKIKGWKMFAEATGMSPENVNFLGMNFISEENKMKREEEKEYRRTKDETTRLDRLRSNYDSLVVSANNFQSDALTNIANLINYEITTGQAMPTDQAMKFLQGLPSGTGTTKSLRDYVFDPKKRAEIHVDAHNRQVEEINKILKRRGKALGMDNESITQLEKISMERFFPSEDKDPYEREAERLIKLGVTKAHFRDPSFQSQYINPKEGSSWDLPKLYSYVFERKRES
jgi:hypothetical protein